VGAAPAALERHEPIPPTPAGSALTGLANLLVAGAPRRPQRAQPRTSCWPNPAHCGRVGSIPGVGLARLSPVLSGLDPVAKTRGPTDRQSPGAAWRPQPIASEEICTRPGDPLRLATLAEFQRRRGKDRLIRGMKPRLSGHFENECQSCEQTE
jgi:hypothetical protein